MKKLRRFRSFVDANLDSAKKRLNELTQEHERKYGHNLFPGIEFEKEAKRMAGMWSLGEMLDYLAEEMEKHINQKEDE